MTFESLGLDEALVRALTASGYENPTDVQARAIPAALAGRDLRVCSNTGSGKTAAFVLPALVKVLAARQDPTQKPQRNVVRGPRILVLVPTRELAMQVAKAASSYGRHVQFLSVTSGVGGVPYPAQLKALRSPLDILIATPGRLIDHIGSGKAVLENVEMLVLDEADRMLDMRAPRRTRNPQRWRLRQAARRPDPDRQNWPAHRCNLFGSRRVFIEAGKDKLPAAPMLATSYGQRWNKDSWKKLFKDAVEVAKLPDAVVMYSLRHTAISEMILEGMDSFIVAKLAGTSVAMIEANYGHLRHDVVTAKLDRVAML